MAPATEDIKSWTLIFVNTTFQVLELVLIKPDRDKPQRICQGATLSPQISPPARGSPDERQQKLVFSGFLPPVNNLGIKVNMLSSNLAGQSPKNEAVVLPLGSSSVVPTPFAPAADTTKPA